MSISAKGVGDALGEAAGDLGLAHLLPIFCAVAADEVDVVRIAAHHVARNVVGEDPVAALAAALGGGFGLDVPGLGGEADEQAGTAGIGVESGEDVGIGLPVEPGRAVGFLELGGRRL